MSMFRRRRHDDSEPPEQRAADAAAETPAPEGPPGKSERSNGPFDETELDLEEARAGRIDLGGLLLRTGEGMKLQLQVDEQSGKATSAMVVMGDAAVQLIPVAAPRSSGLWEQTRLQIATDARRRGGTVEEADGPFGTEIRIVLPVTTADGKKAVQPSRITGIDGPRWMLRATFLGGATTRPDAFARLVQVVRDAVVVRGQSPMPPGDLIALRPPESEPAQA
jgi:Protein of unknown function (DUF3710)